MTCKHCKHLQENNYCTEYGKFVKPTDNHCWYYTINLIHEVTDNLKKQGE